MDTDRLRLLADADVGGRAHRDVVRSHAEVLEVLLDRDADGRTAAPDADDEVRAEPAAVNLRREPEGVLQQVARGDEDLVHGAMIRQEPRTVEVGKCRTGRLYLRCLEPMVATGQLRGMLDSCAHDGRD